MIVFQASDPQGKLFGSFTRLADWVGEDTFYAHLGRDGRRIFDDELFRKLYCKDNGRPCVPPSTLAIATMLQMYDRCSDEEVVERCLFDERWKVALDLDEREKPFAKSTFQEFRSRLLLHEELEEVFLRRSHAEAGRHGLLKGGTKIKAVLDTTPILGRGAVKDTYNLVGDGIRILCRALSEVTEEEVAALTARLDLSRYFNESVSLKGGAEIDWTDGQERRVFLNSLVADAQRLLLEARRIRETASEAQQKAIAQAEELLDKLITQDVEPDPSAPGKIRIKNGTAKDRIPSAHDPEMRHGRKSASKRFDGHKLAVAADPDTGLVTALDVLPGNAPDSQGALQLVKETEANTGLAVEKTVGDCAYGDGASRERFADEQRPLVAKVPAPPSEEPFHKARFQIDLENDRVTCPAGESTTDFKWATSDSGPKVKRFFFPPAVCQACPSKGQCLRTKDETQGRTVTLHPQEPLLQEARQYQKGPEFQQDMKARQQAEHVLARMVQLGARQARYVGRAKTRLQMVFIAAVLNLLVVFNHSHNKQEAPVAVAGCPPPEAPQWPSPDTNDDPSSDDAAQIMLPAHGPRSTTNGIRGAPDRVLHAPRGDP